MSVRAAVRHLSLPLALATLCLPAAAEAGVPRDFVGVTSEDVFAGSPGYRAAALRAQRAAGVGTIRQTFDWSLIERRRGHYDLGYWDDYVAAAAQSGIEIMPILFNAPSFHARRARGSGTAPPRSNRAMARFAKALARRYGPRGSLWRSRPGVPKRPITTWQVWNEPNLRVYWKPRPSARQYVAMLKAVSRAIKSVHRRAEIVTAGLPPSKLSGTIPLPRYIADMYRAGGARWFDTLAVNSYARSARELARLLGSVRRLMNRHGDRRARMRITELGWASGGPRHRFNVGARGQAARISSTFRVIQKLRRRHRIRGVVYYSWRDSRPYPPRYKDMWGLHTGLLDLSGRPKPALVTFQKAVRRLR